MQKPAAQEKLTEGVEGHVYGLIGNQMPMKGKPVQHKGKGVVREIWIYQATTVQQAQGQVPLFNKINTVLAARVKSDSSGRYQAKLPAGSYSAFVKEGTQFFAAETDGKGILNPFEVNKGQITKRDITITLQAAF